MGVNPTLNRPQAEFLALPHKFRAYVAGFGAGKTWAGCASLCKHFWEHPGVTAGYFAPTYPQIRDIFYPTIEEVAYDWGLDVKTNESNKEVHFFSGGRSRGTVICRSMEKPASIVGFKIGPALIDELDTVTHLKAQQAWRKIIARLRLRYDEPNPVNVTTTPEGFGFVYEQWVKLPREKPALQPLYGMVRASTYDNELFLPDDYIPSLVASYPPNLIQAYLNGEFVNLTSGTVYHAYDRKLNHSSETIRDHEPIYVGMDFNVGKMAAVVHVFRGDTPHAVEEVADGYDTPAMCRILRDRYGDRQITVYPDASGGSRKSVDASETDISILKQAGFIIRAPAKNPPVKDRVNAMNAMFCNGEGERRYFVNAYGCPTYAECLEQQVWTQSGEPDKTAGKDHMNDAGGYFIAKEFPIIRRAAYSEPLRM